MATSQGQRGKYAETQVKNLPLKAMTFACHAHAMQVRKYTDEPYWQHLAEVAGIVSTVCHADQDTQYESIAVAWLHDTIKDQNISAERLAVTFGDTVATGVVMLTDAEFGNRAERKRQARLRLAAAPAWVQTIKCADVLSNTGSIFKHDKKFAKVYLQEVKILLEVLDKANHGLRKLAYSDTLAYIDCLENLDDNCSRK